MQNDALLCRDRELDETNLSHFRKILQIFLGFLEELASLLVVWIIVRDDLPKVPLGHIQLLCTSQTVVKTPRATN